MSAQTNIEHNTNNTMSIMSTFSFHT